MPQRAHRPTEPYNLTDPVINRKRVYGPGEVPEGLLTFKQLEKLQPPRKYAPDQKSAGGSGSLIIHITGPRS